MSTIKLPLERCWLIRSPATGNGMPMGDPNHVAPGGMMFWVAGNEWNRSPAHATLFPSEAAARRQIDDGRHHKRASFAPGVIAEAVPLEGALYAHGQEIRVSRPGDAPEASR